MSYPSSQFNGSEQGNKPLRATFISRTAASVFVGMISAISGVSGVTVASELGGTVVTFFVGGAVATWAAIAALSQARKQDG